jgi:hypothetical protein
MLYLSRVERIIHFFENRTKRDELQSQCKIRHRNYIRQYRPRKYHNDIQYQTAKLMRNRLNKMIRQGDRLPRTAEIIGISHQDFLDWIEFQFTEGMNWNNCGTVWCFERCCLLSAFDLTNEEQLKKAMNWRSTRPYCKIRNAEKKASIDPWLSVFQQIKAKKFLKDKINFQLLN